MKRKTTQTRAFEVLSKLVDMFHNDEIKAIVVGVIKPDGNPVTIYSDEIGLAERIGLVEIIKHNIFIQFNEE